MDHWGLMKRKKQSERNQAHSESWNLNTHKTVVKDKVYSKRKEADIQMGREVVDGIRLPGRLSCASHM